jgi:hypothetical protein
MCHSTWSFHVGEYFDHTPELDQPLPLLVRDHDPGQELAPQNLDLDL